MKRQTVKQKCSDLADAIKAMREGHRPKRIGAKDGSIPTHAVVDVLDLPEAEVLKGCMKWLKAHHLFVSRNNTGTGAMGISGIYSYGIRSGGDIIGLLKDGIHLEIECKAGKGGRLSIGQQKRRQDIEHNNGIYLIVHGVEELEFFLEGLI